MKDKNSGENTFYLSIFSIYSLGLSRHMSGETDRYQLWHISENWVAPGPSSKT
jgi:hypothetical protein